MAENNSLEFGRLFHHNKLTVKFAKTKYRPFATFCNNLIIHYIYLTILCNARNRIIEIFRYRKYFRKILKVSVWSFFTITHIFWNNRVGGGGGFLPKKEFNSTTWILKIILINLSTKLLTTFIQEAGIWTRLYLIPETVKNIHKEKLKNGYLITEDLIFKNV